MTISNEQRLQRSRSIGGSDAPVIAGVSPWKTPLALYMEKLGGVSEDIATLPMRVGTALEGVILDEWSRQKGRRVEPFNETLRDSEYPFITGHVDGIVVDESAGVEAKWVGQPTRDWGPADTDVVPPSVFIQCTHYLMLTGYEQWHVAALFGGREFRAYTVKRDESIIAQLRKLELRFWNNVTERIPPPMSLPEDAHLLFRKDDGSEVTATDSIMELCERLKHFRSERASYETLEDKVVAQIQMFMGEAATLRSPTGEVLATWRNTNPVTRVDTRMLRSSFPATYAACLKEGTASRRFALK